MPRHGEHAAPRGMADWAPSPPPQPDAVINPLTMVFN